MATPAAAISLIVVLLLVALTTSGAGDTTFYVSNRCPYTVYPAAITPGGGGRGTVLTPGETWAFTVPAAGASGRIWPRTGCSFDPNTGLGSCSTGDCGGALRCDLPGKPPATLAEFILGSSDDGMPDRYAISVVDGFNTPMDFSCCTGGQAQADAVIRCRDPACPDGNHHPGEANYRTCQGDGYYEVFFCPFP